jgi:hypothetical protein
MAKEPVVPFQANRRDPGRGALAALATVALSVVGWVLAIGVNLVAIGLAIALARRTTPATVAFTVVALIALLAASITLSIWVALYFGHRARRLDRAGAAGRTGYTG